MKRYELVEEYPGSPKVGTIVLGEPVTVWDSDEIVYVSEDGNFSFPKTFITDYPRFWKDADRDKRTMFEKMKDFLETPEGKLSIENFAKELDRKDAQLDRDYERFCRMVDHNGLEPLMDKIQVKYDSNEYAMREMDMGYQPREELNSLAYRYFRENGEETEEGTNEFMDCNYKIGNYLVGMMIGQGTYMKVQKIGEDE